jgi:hypothetical protein
MEQEEEHEDISGGPELDDDTVPFRPDILPPAKEKTPPKIPTFAAEEYSYEVIKFLQGWQGEPVIPPKPAKEGPFPNVPEVPGPGKYPQPYPAELLPPGPQNVKIPGFGDLPPAPTPLFKVPNMLPALMAPQLYARPVYSGVSAFHIVAQSTMEVAVKGLPTPQAMQAPQLYMPPPKSFGGGAPLLEPALVVGIETIVAQNFAQQVTAPVGATGGGVNWQAVGMAGAVGAAVAGGGYFFNAASKLNSAMKGGRLVAGY